MSPTPYTRSLLQEMCRVAKYCYERGWSYGTAGNFSVRSGNTIWQSPSGWCKGDLRVEMFIPVDLKTGEVMRRDGSRPSLEMPVHLGIYRARPQVRCVVHTHPLQLVRATEKNAQALQFKDKELAKALGLKSHVEELTLPIYPNATPEEMLTLAPDVEAWSKDVAMIILAGHGVYASGATPLEALAYIEALEHLCSL